GHARWGEHLGRPFPRAGWLVLLAAAFAPSAGATPPRVPPPSGDIGGSVADSTNGTPLPGGEVRVMRAGGTVAIATTDAFGRYVIHNLPAGAYTVEVRYLGYRAETREVTVQGEDQRAAADFRLVAIPLNLSAVEVTAAVPLAVDTRTGNQIFKQRDYHGSPTTAPSQLIQQPIVGPARAP